MEMIARVVWEGQVYEANLASPISLALPLRPDVSSVRAWHAPQLRVEPVRVGEWVGAVSEGAPVNFMNLHINPHGNGTHTETLGHIAANWASNTVLSLLPPSPFVSILRNVPVDVQEDGGHIVNCDSLRQNPPTAPGLVLRVLTKVDLQHDFSETDPPYFRARDLAWLADLGVQHLITDLPSVDREVDGGELAAHHAWWRYPTAPRRGATITELARLDTSLAEGLYLTWLNALPLAMDASPSHPLLYPLTSSLAEPLKHL